MANAVGVYEGGIHNRIEVAISETGRVYRRHQFRDPRYGYRWTCWEGTGETFGQNMLANPPATRSAGFSTLYFHAGLARRLPA